jgi:hypothetical protein
MKRAGARAKGNGQRAGQRGVEGKGMVKRGRGKDMEKGKVDKGKVKKEF